MSTLILIAVYAIWRLWADNAAKGHRMQQDAQIMAIKAKVAWIEHNINQREQ